MHLDLESYGIHQQVDGIKERVMPAHLGIQDVVNQFVQEEFPKEFIEFDLILLAGCPADI